MAKEEVVEEVGESLHNAYLSVVCSSSLIALKHLSSFYSPMIVCLRISFENLPAVCSVFLV